MLVGWGRLAGAVVILLAGCAPYPLTAAGMQDQAIRMAATETAWPVRETAQAQASQAAATQAAQMATQQAGQATSAAATAAMLRATEISAEATNQAVNDRALVAHAQASATAAWLNGQLTVIPVYLQATATRRAELAERQELTENIGWWAVVVCVAALALYIAGVLVRREMERVVDRWTVVRDMARVRRQGAQPFDVSKEAGDGQTGT